MPTCKKCQTDSNGEYCQDCGRAFALKRIDARYLRDELAQVLTFEKGFFFTVRELVLRPGPRVREFLTQDRGRLVKPVIFIIITSVLYTLINQLFDIEDGYVKYDEGPIGASAVGKIFQWIQHHYGYANIIMGGFIALWVSLFFKRACYNFFEVLILLCFVMGIAMLIFVVFGIVSKLNSMRLAEVGGMVSVGYCSWAIGQFFGVRNPFAYLKALAAYLLGMTSFMFFAVLLGMLIDVIRA